MRIQPIPGARPLARSPLGLVSKYWVLYFSSLKPISFNQSAVCFSISSLYSSFGLKSFILVNLATWLIFKVNWPKYACSQLKVSDLQARTLGFSWPLCWSNKWWSMTCVRHSCRYSYQVLFPSLLCSSFFISTHYSISTRRIKRIVWSNDTLNRSSRTGLSVLHFPTQCTNLKLLFQDALCMFVLGSASYLARERT